MLPKVNTVLSKVLISLSLCAPIPLSSMGFKDIKPAADEIFSCHVEHHHFNPTLANRFFKTFFRRFDPDRLLLLKSEANPYLNLQKWQVDLLIEQFQKGNFTELFKIQKLIEQSTLRARKMRAKIRSNLLKSPSFEKVTPFPIHLDPPEDLQALQHKTERLMQSWLTTYAKTHGKEELTADEKMRVLNFYEKKRRQHEDTFMGMGQSVEEKLSLNILKALSASLDPHSMFYSQNEAIDLRNFLLKQVCGIGILLKEDIDGPKIGSIVPNSPAHASTQIELGDIVREINGAPIDHLYFNQVLHLLNGPENSKLSLLLEGKDKVRKAVTLFRKKITLDSERIQVSSEPFAGGIIGTITLSSFYDNLEGINVEKDLKEAIKQLSAQAPVKGLIIDMRQNAGGFLNQAVRVAGLFIPNGVVVIGKYADEQLQYNQVIEMRSFYDGPLVILTSKASASAAEIVAQALKDEGRVVIVGDERTYGKGSMQYQTITDPNAKHFYKVTVGRYYTVSGNSTQLSGVAADILVPTPLSKHEIGEKYLMYPLANEPFIKKHTVKQDLQRLFDRFTQRRKTPWEKMIPTLKKNSEMRLAKDKNFQSYLTEDGKGTGQDDLHITEATRIIKDMIFLSKS